jgi:hypothetical protein
MEGKKLQLCVWFPVIWNVVGCSLEEKGVKVPLFMHHYGMMYGMLLVLFYMACQSMYQDVMVPSHWLDDDATRSYVMSIMDSNGECDMDQSGECTSDVFKQWEHEATLTIFPRLKEFSMFAPLWCLLTILVCIWHTHQHINKIRANRDEGAGTKGRLVDCPQHNQTMTVLVLPAVYGLLSFKSTCRMWQVMINHIPVVGAHHDTSAVAFNGYEERKTFLLEMYDANFMVGDIYETYALVTFGNLVMGVLKKKIDKMKVVFELETADRSDAGEMKDYIERLVDSMKTLTVAGVKLFAMSCLLQGIYTLVITTCAFDFPGFMPEYFSRDASNLGTFQQEEMKATAHNFFLGAGFIASFAAIGNIMIIEEDFEALLEEFKPSLKFWGTKILVSLAFLQSILISMFLTPNGWSEIQSDLMYSCCLGVECLLIAIFHIKGWSADEVWYGDYEMARRKASLTEPLMKSNVPSENK